MALLITILKYWYNHTKGGIWIFFQRLQIIHFCGLVWTLYSGTFGNIFWPVVVDSFENFDSEIKPFSKNLPYITTLMEWLNLFISEKVISETYSSYNTWMDCPLGLSAQPRVTSKKSPSERRSRKAPVTLDSKSCHWRHRFSEVVPILSVI